MYKALISAITLSLVFVFFSCKPKSFFQESKVVATTGWAYADTLAFQFEVTDTSKRYTMQLDVAWADSFQHQNLYLKLGTVWPGGKYTQVVRSYDLYDQEGKPNGEKTSGSYKGSFILQDGTRFNQPGTYQLTVAQHSREEKLTGIQNVGLCIKEEEKNSN